MAELRLPRVFRPGIVLHRRMAGARRGRDRGAGPRHPTRVSGRSARRGAERARCAWRCLARLGLAALALFLGVAAAQAQIASAPGQILSTRIWPAKDYTRVTLESKTEIRFQLFAVKDPERLVLDLE